MHSLLPRAPRHRLLWTLGPGMISPQRCENCRPTADFFFPNRREISKKQLTRSSKADLKHLHFQGGRGAGRAPSSPLHWEPMGSLGATPVQPNTGEGGLRDLDFNAKRCCPAQPPSLLHSRRSSAGLLAGSGRSPVPSCPRTMPYLHNFLCYLPRLVDIQDDFGVSHHRVESPSFTQAERTGKRRR